MQKHQVRVHPSSAQLPREKQLAWKIAGVAADDVPIEPEVAAAVIDRVIDDAAVAIAAINRGPVVAAREMALGHPRAERRDASSACLPANALARSGPPGPTARPCANSTCTTRFWPPIIPIPETTSRPSLPSRRP